MIKNLIFLSFFPIFILLYLGSSLENNILGIIGIVLFLAAAVIQFVSKN